MNIKIKKLHPNAIIPKYAKIGDAGLDLTAVDLNSNSLHITYKTGLAIAIPEGFVGLLFPRSSVYKTGQYLTNSVGVIDSGYRGEIMLKFSQNDPSSIYKIGDRVGQLIVIPYPQVKFEEVEDLGSTDRGQGGFGSTGN